MDQVPREEDSITVWEGWCSENIHYIDWTLDPMSVDITLTTSDPDGKYAEELKRRGGTT